MIIEVEVNNRIEYFDDDDHDHEIEIEIQDSFSID